MISWSEARYWGASQLKMAGIETPTAQARQLLKNQIDDLSPALVSPDERMGADRWRRYTVDVARRTRREPMQYIRGEVEFHSMLFRVDERALIPRPETELLVEVSSRLLHESPSGPVLDMCTGTGVVAICLALEHSLRHCVGVDINAAALELARANALRHGVHDRVAFVCGNLFDPIDDGPYAAIVCNPPYVESEIIKDLQPEVSHWEPTAALDGGYDGLQVIRGLLQAAPNYLLRGGFLALEMGAGQADAVRRLCLCNGLTPVGTACDLAGIERVVVCRRA